MDDVVLGHVADHAPELPQVGVQVDAIEAHRSRAGRGDTSDRLQQHRLAGTAGTDDRDELTSRDRERHGVQHRDLAPAADPNPSGQLVDVDAKTLGVDARNRRRRCPVPAANVALPPFAQPGTHRSPSGR